MAAHPHRVCATFEGACQSKKFKNSSNNAETYYAGVLRDSPLVRPTRLTLGTSDPTRSPATVPNRLNQSPNPSSNLPQPVSDSPMAAERSVCAALILTGKGLLTRSTRRWRMSR